MAKGGEWVPRTDGRGMVLAPHGFSFAGRSTIVDNIGVRRTDKLRTLRRVPELLHELGLVILLVKGECVASAWNVEYGMWNVECGSGRGAHLGRLVRETEIVEVRRRGEEDKGRKTRKKETVIVLSATCSATTTTSIITSCRLGKDTADPGTKGLSLRPVGYLQ